MVKVGHQGTDLALASRAHGPLATCCAQTEESDDHRFLSRVFLSVQSLSGFHVSPRRNKKGLDDVKETYESFVPRSARKARDREPIRRTFNVLIAHDYWEEENK